MIPIPAELLPLILGYLTNDMFTLKQCATVSHKFNFFTRAALFYRIKVRSEAEVCSLTETIRRHPDIGDVVREIRVVVSSGTTSELTSFATHLPGLLPKLRSIDLSELSRATWTFGQLGHYFSGFKSVNELLFFGSSFALPFVLASALPSLNHLSIRYHGASLRDPPPNMPPAPPALHLSSFSFHGSPSSSADSAFSWILSTDSRHTLRAVKLFVPLPRAETYGSFIRELGSELEHLDLMFPPSVNMTGMSPRINLEENVGLISLVLRNAPSPFLRALLSTIPSSSVQSVTLFIPSFSGEDSEDFVELWSLRQLDGNHFEGLNQLVFVFRGDSRDRLITQQKVEEVYDTYTKAGMLKVIDMPEFERRCLGMGFGPSML